MNNLYLWYEYDIQRCEIPVIYFNKYSHKYDETRQEGYQQGPTISSEELEKTNI